MLNLCGKVQAKKVVNNDAKILGFVTVGHYSQPGLGIDNQQLLQFLNAEFQMSPCITPYLA
jgi:hypothetical protein